jgi:shikimate kinase
LEFIHLPDLLDDVVVVVVTGGEVMGNEPGLAALLDGCFRLGMWLEVEEQKSLKEIQMQRKRGVSKKEMVRAGCLCW